ncbi:MAG TPA: hypothetical protein VES73_11625 [Lamprocystis sp. (in: g-proteobacteria)]|nr:hypothetical protein [Lamprocystis sp. (in: g-proteobacteria)]
MSADHSIRRYTAFFRGWAQAFGEHQTVWDRPGGMRWLIADGQVGLILEPSFKRLLFPLFLHRPGRAAPEAVLSPDALVVGDTRIPLAATAPAPLPQILDLLARATELHLYQTYHLVYPAGTRILTLSARPPLSILYRELLPLRLRVAENPAGERADEA